MPDPHLRAADSDRQAVAATLGRALSDGRLTVDEYEERLAKAYAARTYGELGDLTTDLPRSGAMRPPVETPAAAPGRPSTPAGVCGPGPWGRRRTVWGSWLTTTLIVLGIWLASSVSSGHAQNFWPVWVIVPWGAVLLARTISGGPARLDRRHDRHDRYRHDRRLSH